MTHDPPELVEFLGPYPEHVQQLTLDARRKLHDLLGPVSDLLFDATAAVCCGFSYTGLPKHNFFNLAVYSDHVTLIFPFGVRLEDPENRLKGEGSQVRNMRLTNLELLDDPYVVGLIRQAQDQAIRPAEPIEPVKYVKVYDGPKRRPRPTN